MCGFKNIMFNPKQIFIWWHRQTLGTFLKTLFFGKYVGRDEYGNKYYKSKKNERWVVYGKESEASKITSDWYLWIHFLKKNKPSKDSNKFSWQIKHKENMTGTKEAYKPEGSLTSDLKKNTKKYETWKV